MVARRSPSGQGVACPLAISMKANVVLGNVSEKGAKILKDLHDELRPAQTALSDDVDTGAKESDRKFGATESRQRAANTVPMMMLFLMDDTNRFYTLRIT